MATATTLVPLESYLATNYRPDCDWIDGELKARNMGEKPHSRIQQYLCQYLGLHEQGWGILVYPEQRVQTSAHHYRVADVCVTVAGDDDEYIVRIPPLLCVEILSRTDSLDEIDLRVQDYLQMGVRQVWVVDPTTRLAYDTDDQRVLVPQGERLTVPATAIEVQVQAMFAALDKR